MSLTETIKLSFDMTKVLTNMEVNGIKINNSNIDVIPINDNGLELDLIRALQIACESAENKINIKIKLIDINY